MTAKGLRVAPGVVWPLDAVTETLWWSGVRGSGKTHDCSVFVEELLRNRLQVVVIDPMRAWWGLRSSSDGKDGGYSIPIFGGPRGDVPLASDKGVYMADLAMAERVSMVLDVKDWNKAELRRFTGAFLDRLRRRNTEPMHLVVEETPIFAPQKPQKGNEALLGIVEEIVRLGRGSGIGFSAVSQRSAHLNTEVRAQIEVLVAHRTAAPLDRAAIKAWFDVHDPERVSEAMARLPFLPTGTAVVSSTEFLETFGEVAFRPRTTFDSSATPKVGQRVREARTLADVDLGAIQVAMAETIERAKADDPRELRHRIAELERQLAAKPRVDRVVEEVEVHVEVPVPVLDEDLVLRLEKALEPAGALMGEIQERLDWKVTDGDDGNMVFTRQLRDDRPPVPPRRGDGGGAGDGRQPGTAPVAPVPDRRTERDGNKRRPTVEPAGAAQRSGAVARRDRGGPPVPGAATDQGRRVAAARATFERPSSPPGSRIGDGAPRRILTVLATHGPLLPARAGFMASVSARKSTLRNALSTLRSQDLIVTEDDGRLAVTDAGLAELGDFDPLPTGEALLDYWRAQVGTGKPREIFEVLLDAHPDALSSAQVADLLDLDPGVSTLRNALSTLRSLGVVEGNAKGNVVSPALMDAVGR